MLDDRTLPRPCRAAGAAILLAVLGLPAAAPVTAAEAVLQPQDNPVYIEDSPRAWELFQRAVDQTASNTAEAARLVQELLDEVPLKLAPVSELAGDHFTAVRRRVLAQLLDQPELLARYRSIQQPEAQRMLDRGELDRLALTRSLTGPGLEALIRLAQHDLENARFRAAADHLEEAAAHPDLDPARAAHCWFMAAVAGHYLHDTALLTTALAELDELGPAADEVRPRLHDLVGDGSGPAILTGVSPLDRTQTTDLTDLVAEEIWSVPLEDSLLTRRYGGSTLLQGGAPGPGEHSRRSGELMTAAATVAGATVYVNQGHTVLALDRFTGRRRWDYVDRHRMGLTTPDADQSLDMNLVSVRGDAVVTIIGHATSDGRASDGKVVCLDATDGTVRWSRGFESIAGTDEEDQLFPHGRPLIEEGSVYVLARKVTPQFLTTCYAVALDLATGEVRWAHHLASTGGLKKAARELSTLAWHRGDLYVATPVGAIARLRADTGEVRWLRRYNVPLSTSSSETTRRPWEMPAPVVIGERVVAMQPAGQRIVVLDRATGHEVAGYATDTRDGWASPSYLLADERRVYAIGREVRAFDVEALAQPLWQLPRAGDPITGSAATDGRRLEIRGRVQLAQGALIVPTLDGVLVVDRESGELQHKLPVSAIGTPVATDSQLLLAGSDRLDAFMSFRRAERMLRERIAAAPSDPEPSLSLLRLGARARRLDLALEAAELALNAIGGEPLTPAARRGRDELFALLLEIDETGVAESADQGEALHAVISTVAATPEQRVEHLLAYGRWLTRHSLARAVERYQAILSERRLATVRRSEQGMILPASAWAARRLAGLIDQHGPAAYAPQADFARMRLRQMLEPGSADPQQLAALAAEFPFSVAAIDASLHAAEGMAAEGRRREALSMLVLAYRRSPGPEAAQRLLGAYASICAAAGWHGAATAALDQVIREAGPDALVGAGPAVARRPASAWRAELAQQRGAGRLPRLGERAGTARAKAGRLVPLHEQADAAAPVDRVMLVEGTSLVELGHDRRERWRFAGDDPAPQLLARHPGRALLWLASRAGDPRAMMLDTTRGAELWSTPPLDRHLGDPIRDLRQERGVLEQMPGGGAFDPRQSLPIADGERLVIAQRSGGIVAFDLADGTVPIWTVKHALEQIHHVALDELGLVVAGLEHQLDPLGGPAEPVPAVMVIDPETGATLHRITPFGRAGVRWMAIAPLGQLVFGTDDAMEAVELLTGEKRWVNIAYFAGASRESWPAADVVVVEDREGDLRAVDLADGAMSPPFDPPPHDEWETLELRGVRVAGERLWAHYSKRVLCFDVRGGLVGADVISDSRDYRWVLPIDGGLIVVNRYAANKPDPVSPTEHTYRIYKLAPDGRLRAELELPPVTQHFTEAAVIDGTLLLSNESETAVIPLVR